MVIMSKKYGVLVFDCEQERPDIRFDSGEYYGGLHCGNTLDIYYSNQWIPTRIEYSDEEELWYCFGIKSREILYSKVRI